MKNNNSEPKICPKCGETYLGCYPAVSRVDNKTLICPICATREALESIGVNAREQEEILEIIHSHERS